MTVIGQTRRQFAAELGCSVGWVQALVNAGRCVLTPDGKINAPESRKRIAETADPGRKDVADRHAEARGAAIGRQHARPVAQPSAPPTGDAGVELPATGRAKAKTMLLGYENAQLKIEMALRRGLRFERSAVRREAQGLGAMLRAGVERVIDQTAPRLAAAKNAMDRRRILDDEIRRLRRMMKREMPRALRRMQSENLQKKPESAAT